VEQDHHLIVLCGPTGIGKTGVAISIAQHIHCDILSADSRQLFREMSIGTAVPSDQELQQVPHHFIRSHSIHQYFNASMYEQEVLDFLRTYFSSNNTIVMAGGSGLYIDAVCRGIDDLPTIRTEIRTKWRNIFETQGIGFLQSKVSEVDPEYYKQVDRQNHKRLLKAVEVYEQTGKPYSGFLKRSAKPRPFKIYKIGLNCSRKQLYSQINQRVDQMIEKGLLDEARALYDYRNLTPLKTVGYRELFEHFDGRLSRKEATEQIKNHTRAYARRQLTWFRRDKEIIWFEPEQLQEIIRHIELVLAGSKK
jgi:tRNA dimethylallyltransferase